VPSRFIVALRMEAKDTCDEFVNSMNWENLPRKRGNSTALPVLNMFTLPMVGDNKTGIAYAYDGT